MMGCNQGKVNQTRHYGKKLLFVGPPDSGKTTALYYLKLNVLVKTIPTPHYNVETINTEKNTFEAIDIGSGIADRNVYIRLMEDAGMVLLFIDSTRDQKRLNVAASRLELVLSELPLRFVPVTIVASKYESENVTLTYEKMTEFFQTKPYMKHRYWKVCPVSVFNDGDGFLLMLQWIDDHYGRIMEEGPEYQAILNHHREQALIRKQQEEGLRITMRELEKIQFEKNKLNKSKRKAKMERRKRRDLLRNDAVLTIG